jgi:hypothetical protein
MVEINWHASLNKLDKKMGVRLIIRDVEGFFFWQLCNTVPLIIDPTIAGVVAAWKAT